MSKEKSKIFDPRNRQILYAFWDSLPKIKFVKDAENIYYAHAARQLILKALGEGLKEEIDGDEKIRRALNAQEIFQRINVYREEERSIEGIDWKNFDVSLHSLYFHIQKMEEIGLIKTVSILREGRHNVSYYGRVAQVLIFRIDYEEYEKIKNAFDAMAKLGHLNEPKFQPEKILEFYDKYISIGQNHSKQLFELLSNYELALDKAEVDPGDILNFIELLFTVNPEYIKLIEEIKQYLNLGL